MKANDGLPQADIIDHIYDVALDPARYEQLLDAWEKRMASMRDDRPDGLPLIDPSLEMHARRASEFLDRVPENAANGMRARLSVEVAAAFCVDCNGVILDTNKAATDHFNLDPGMKVSALHVDQRQMSELTAAIKAAAGQGRNTSILRLNTSRGDHAIIFHISPCEGPDGSSAAFVRTSQIGWPKHLTQMLKEAFKLTLAEIEVVRSLVEGKSLKDIGLERARSFETVRAQLRSVLAKTETRSQTELIRITLSLMDVVPNVRDAPAGLLATPGKLEPLPYQTMMLPDGRRHDFIEFGDPDGRPLVFLPIDYGLIRWPISAEKEAAHRGIRVIVPVRAGFGHSSPLPPKVNVSDMIAEDMGRLLDHLQIAQASFITLGADIRYAMKLAVARPSLVSGIVACSGTLPISSAAQYERMGKWHRFILANARYAPLILPFIVKAGFVMARKIGKEQFLNSVNSGSPADIETFAMPEVREAMIMGSEICLSDWHIAHEAFSRECLDSESDWSDVVRKCPAPIRMLQGGQDPQIPRATVEELMPIFPNCSIEIIDDAGQLLFFKYWKRTLDEVEKFLV